MARFPAVALIAATLLCAPPLSAQTLTGIPQVHDGDTLVLQGERVRLFGIDAPELKQTCADAKGGDWPCGNWARTKLVALAGRQVTCIGIERDRYGRLVARCRNRSGDLGEEMVKAGAAFAYRDYALDYVDAEKRAAIAGTGIWMGEATAPSVWRAEQAPAPQDAPGRCRIKGNISDNGRLYHLPGMRSYDRTRINERAGERWFCSEAEARAAGWRRAGGG